MSRPTIVHVNRHVISKNKRTGANEPDIAVRKSRGAKAKYARSVSVLDQAGNVVATLSSHRDKPLSCGATVWLECMYGVVLDGEKDDAEVLQREGGEVPAVARE